MELAADRAASKVPEPHDRSVSSRAIDSETDVVIDSADSPLPTDKKLTVDVSEDKAAANLVANSDSKHLDHPQYSYVLCRDAQSAMDNLKACTSKMKQGESCGDPHTISLILPAKVVGLDDDNHTSLGQPALAEVQCSITSVAKIPNEVSIEEENTSTSSDRVIATVPETGTVIVDH